MSNETKLSRHHSALQQKLTIAKNALEAAEDITEKYDTATALGCRAGKNENGTVIFKLSGYIVGTVYVGQRTTGSTFRPEPVSRTFDEAVAGVDYKPVACRHEAGQLRVQVSAAGGGFRSEQMDVEVVA